MIVKIPWLLRIKAALAGVDDPEAFKALATTVLGVFIVVGDDPEALKPEVINHERIHLAQWRELLYLGFPIVFYGILLYRLVTVRNRELALLHHPMEREAYRFMDDLGYLSKRLPFAWRHLDA